MRNAGEYLLKCIRSVGPIICLCETTAFVTYMYGTPFCKKEGDGHKSLLHFCAMMHFMVFSSGVLVPSTILLLQL